MSPHRRDQAVDAQTTGRSAGTHWLHGAVLHGIVLHCEAMIARPPPLWTRHGDGVRRLHRERSPIGDSDPRPDGYRPTSPTPSSTATAATTRLAATTSRPRPCHDPAPANPPTPLRASSGWAPRSWLTPASPDSRGTCRGHRQPDVARRRSTAHRCHCRTRRHRTGSSLCPRARHRRLPGRRRVAPGLDRRGNRRADREPLWQHRQPTPAQFRDLDVVIFDLQDVGSRPTPTSRRWVWPCRRQRVRRSSSSVLDRPNPAGGERVSGFVLEPGRPRSSACTPCRTCTGSPSASWRR